MAGHSQFKNIMHRKGRQDALRAKVFSKLAREITVAAKSGLSDPSMNPRLRLAIQNARAASMPKENIQRAITKASSIDTVNYEQVRYEGYAPGGVTLIVEALTDNRKRTASNIRAAFAKVGGDLGEPGSVAFMWDRVGEIVYRLEAADSRKMLEAVLNAGAQDLLSDERGHIVICDFHDIGEVAKFLEEALGDSETVKIIWKPKSNVLMDEEHARILLKLISVLEEDDDVQNVYANFEMDEGTIDKLSENHM